MADGITRIAVEGFKSIATKQSIDIAPLTILAGANSSGKSSIMQPLLMLKQTLEAQYDPGPLKIDGPNVKFTSADQFLSRAPDLRNGEKTLKLEIRTGGQALLGLTFIKRAESYILEESWTDDDRTQVLRSDWTPEEIRSKFGDLNVLRDRFWLRLARSDEGEDITSRLHSSFKTRVPIGSLQELLLRIIHVPGLRGNPEREYPVTGAGPNFPGTFQYYVASVIARWQSDDGDLYECLNRDLRHIKLTDRVVARRVNEVALDLLVSRLEGGRPDDLVSVADVGLGVSHILPVLVALRATTQGRLVFVEQPEIHLHPRAQIKLADVLTDAAKRGVRIVAETHSSLLLRAIQTLVAKGDLPPDLVRFHWFSRDADGITHVSSVTPDENGAFGDWPEDFGDVALQSEKDYLDAVETKLAR